MQSTVNPKRPDDDILVMAPGVVLSAHPDKEFPTLAPDAQVRARPGISGDASVPPIDPVFRAASFDNILESRPSIGRRVMRALVGVVLAACIGVAGSFAWQAYGDTAKQIIVGWAPQPGLNSSPPPDITGQSAQPNSPAGQASPINPAAPAQPVAAARSAEVAAPAVTTISDDSRQSLQSMARDLATLREQVGQLEASIEQLKTGQEQMSREINRAPPQTVRPRIAAPAPRSAAVPARRPAPSFSPPQAAVTPTLPQVAASPAPPQLGPPPQAAVQPQDELAPRPPLPVR